MVRLAQSKRVCDTTSLRRMLSLSVGNFLTKCCDYKPPTVWIVRADTEQMLLYRCETLPSNIIPVFIPSHDRHFVDTGGWMLSCCTANL